MTCVLPEPVRPPTSFFEGEFRAFAEADARTPPPRDALLFYGSSSIRLWNTLASDFAGAQVVNRGFGGSTLAECVQQIDRLIIPLAPRAIVFYAGDNDLAQGASPERIQELFEEFAELIDDRLGVVPLVFISIKISPSRAGNAANILRANALTRSTVERWPNSRYVDVCSLMLDAGGHAQREYFCEDWLHLSPAGYTLWAREVGACLRSLALLP